MLWIRIEGNNDVLTFVREDRVVGEINLSDFRLTKFVEGEQHLLRKMDAWALDEQMVKVADGLLLTQIVVVDKGSNTVYEVLLHEFLKYAVPVDYGFGKQLSLSRKYWRVNKS